jgi:ATP-binding cassette subfamily B protein RaxB
MLARALYAQPRILFLDEATSHLDPQTELHIHQTLRELNITRVIVAHRRETLAIADRVIHLAPMESEQEEVDPVLWSVA